MGAGYSYAMDGSPEITQMYIEDTRLHQYKQQAGLTSVGMVTSERLHLVFSQVLQNPQLTTQIMAELVDPERYEYPLKDILNKVSTDTNLGADAQLSLAFRLSDVTDTGWVSSEEVSSLLTDMFEAREAEKPVAEADKIVHNMLEMMGKSTKMDLFTEEEFVQSAKTHVVPFIEELMASNTTKHNS